jgi:16S rRNA (adenine1518-N6/adenine1519-N6)-dimethyltransferase
MPKYSQNFLTDKNTLKEIIYALSTHNFDYLVEIGPGKGFLTKELINKFGSNFSAIEIDEKMINHLKRNIAPCSLPNIIKADFLKLDLEKTLPHKKIGFVGNLPYAVASPILQKVLNFKYFHTAIFMFQKEVANRITAKTDNSAYGVLTLSVNLKAEAKRVCSVKKNYFRPVPKVDSAVVEFKKLTSPVFSSELQEQNFLKVVKLAFTHKRKTILNSLSKSLGWDKTTVLQLLEKTKIAPNLRPQNITISQYIKLVENL